MKNTLLLLIFLTFGVYSFGQEVENPRFNLKQQVVSNQLLLETMPVNEMQIGITIFTANSKDVNDQRLTEQITIYRGKATHAINISDLPSGDYFIEIFQEKIGRIFRKQFTKK